MNDSMQDDRAVIRDLVEKWTVWKDTGDFERFRTVWHDDGAMYFTWFQGSVDEFVEFSRGPFEEDGPNVMHSLGGTVIDLQGDRAIARSRVTASFRMTVDGVLVDLSTHGRYVDFFERRSGRWGMVFRQPVYERDRLDPVYPGEVIPVDRALLESFPEGCRFLAYAQTRAGYQVKTDVPVRTGAVLGALERAADAWLEGGELTWPAAPASSR